MNTQLMGDVMKKNIGFISFRISGTDGVSLETKKWAEVLENNGNDCFYMAGELDTPENKSFIAPEAHFTHPGIKKLYAQSFDQDTRSEETTKGIHEYRIILKKRLYQFIKMFDLDVIVPQNTLTIPLNVSLALALTEVIAETGIPTIAHHHDFFWERKRFLTNCVWDYLNCAFPPHLPSVHHVVINTSAQNQLALRTGISSILVPNVMEFENEPVGIDDYNSDLRQEMGIADDELLVLQPTRVVQRKGIEHAIELVARLGRKAVLVISHASGDEGFEYEQRVMEFAEVMNIRALFVDDRIDEARRLDENGKKIYTLGDIYPHADLVTYPSLVEGFGNAFLEAILYRRMILVNNYSIYSHDIKPKGFEVIEMDNFISAKTIKFAQKILDSPDRTKKMTDLNYDLGLKHYSYTVLEEKLIHLMTLIFGKEAGGC